MSAYVVFKRGERQKFFGDIQQKAAGLGHRGEAQLRKFSGATGQQLRRWERGTHLATTDSVKKLSKGFKVKPGNSFMVYDESGKYLGKGMAGMIRAKSTKSNAWKSGGEQHWGAPPSTPWASGAVPPRMGSGGMRANALPRGGASTHSSGVGAPHLTGGARGVPSHLH